MPDLGHRRFQCRESAQRALAALGPVALPALSRARSHPDAEVRERASRLLDRYRGELALLRVRGLGRLPWLALPEDEQEVQQGVRWLRVARDMLNPRGEVGRVRTGEPDWPEYRKATELWLVSQLVQRRPESEWREELVRMWQEERDWIRANRQDSSPPLRPAR